MSAADEKTRVKVKDLIALLEKLPENTRVCTSGLEGIYPVELGNLFPLKVMQTRFGTVLFFDDGIAANLDVMDYWQPLDEFVAAITPPTGEIH